MLLQQKVYLGSEYSDSPVQNRCYFNRKYIWALSTLTALYRIVIKSECFQEALNLTDVEPMKSMINWV